MKLIITRGQVFILIVCILILVAMVLGGTFLGRDNNGPKIEAARTLHDEAMYCREAVKNGSKPYGEIGRCQQLREFVAIYYAAGKPHDEDRIWFYKAQSYAWEAVAISNALYPEQADATIW